MSKNLKSNLFKGVFSAVLSLTLVFALVLTSVTANATASIKKYNYETVLKLFEDTGAQGQVKQYIKFLQDPTYTPSIANRSTYMPALSNANTFVNKDFDIKPSIFAALRSVNTSVLDSSRKYLWIGTDNGVTKINLKDNSNQVYDKDNGSLKDNEVLLLINDEKTGVYTITVEGVSHIKK